MKKAISKTTQVIYTRTRKYRNLVIVISLVSLLSIISSLIFLSFIPSLGFFLLIPICGGYFYSDVQRINQWQRDILQLWINENLDIDHYKEIMTSISELPPKTLQSMLDTLPKSDKKQKTNINSLNLLTKKTISKTIDTLNINQSIKTAISVSALTIGLGAVTTALILRQWLPLIAFILIPAIIGTGKYLQKQKIKTHKKRIYKLKKNPKFEKEIFTLICNRNPSSQQNLFK